LAEATPADPGRGKNPNMTVQAQTGAQVGEKPREWGQIIRFLLVGGWNTAFGYCLYVAFTYLLTGVIPYAYMAAHVLAYVLSITVAYFGYKFLVFKTKGNYLREYLRTYLVYGASCLMGLVLLPVAVMLVRPFCPKLALAPYIAQAFVLPIVVATSYFGHKKFSFRPRRDAP
jgi:putative flippase GtrA